MNKRDLSFLTAAIKDAVQQGIDSVRDEINKPVINYGEVIKDMANPIAMRREADETKGTSFAGVVRSLAAGGGGLEQAKSFASRVYGSGSAISKALGASQLDAGGILVPDDISRDVIELLRPLSVVRKGNPRIVRVARGTKTFPRITASASVAYVDENEDIPSSRPTFGGVVMSARKLAALVPISNELLQMGIEGAEEIIRTDLVSELAKVEDSAFLRGDGTAHAPKGFRYQASAANISNTNGTSAVQIEQDIVDLIDDLSGANIGLEKAAFIMPTRSRNRLFNLRDASSGQLVFPEVREGRLFGQPLFATNNVPTNLGGGSSTEIYLVAFDQILLGEVEGIRIETSREGSYIEDGNLVSAFSRDQTLIRLVMFHDLGVRNPEAIAIKTGVAW